MPQPARVFRISFTGEAGYELHVGATEVATLWHRLWDEPAAASMGLAPFGGMAVNALRIEKAFRVKGDLDYAHWQVRPRAQAIERTGDGHALGTCGTAHWTPPDSP